MRFGFVVACLALLSACDGVATPSDTTPAGRLALLGGAVTVAGPEGFCADVVTSRPRRGFAMFAACATLSGEGRLPALNAVAVVQVGDAGSASVAGSEPAMAALLNSDAGAALLARSGGADTITIDAVRARNGVVTVDFTDRTPPAIAGLQPQEWRAFLDVRGRLVTISLRGLAATPLTTATGDVLLARFVAALQAENPALAVTDS